MTCFLFFSFFVYYAIPSSCINIPIVVDDTCYPDVEQQCDEVASITKADPSVVTGESRYFLFTRKNRKLPEMLHLCNGTLPRNTKFNPKNRLIGFIPGYVYGFCQMNIISKIKDELLEKGDFNVLIFDNQHAYGLDYAEALSRLQDISNQNAKVLQNIQDQTGLKNRDVYLAGHSLGAHTAGIIANKFKVHRITGIDPAGIEFDKKKNVRLRLDRTDADIVDIFHCNGGKGIPDFGLIYPAGDADFYINGGARQKSCQKLIWNAMWAKEFGFAMALLSSPITCSHAVCLYYYYLSINNEYGAFKGWPCDSYSHFKEGRCTGKGSEPVIMGFDYETNFTNPEVHKSSPQKYYLDTEAKYPYVKKDGGLPRKDKAKYF